MVVMRNVVVKTIATSLAALVVLVNATPVFAASYSCDTAEESFFTPSGSDSSSSGGNTPSGGSGTSGSADSTDTSVDVVPTPVEPDPVPNVPSEDFNQDNTGSTDSASTDGKGSSSNSGSSSWGTVDSSSSVVYVPVVSAGTDTTTDAPSLNASADSDGVPASVKSNWTYTLNKPAKQITLNYYVGSSKNVSVPNTVKVNGSKYQVLVSNKLFYRNTDITSVTFGKSVRTIKGSCYKMFLGCTNLKTVKNLPSDTTSIRRAFMGCKKLTSVTCPELVVNANQAFSGCKNLKTVKFSGTNLLYANQVFNGCASLKSVSGISKKQASKIKGFYSGVSKSIVK